MKYCVRCRNSACRHRRMSLTHPDNYVSEATTPVCTKCGQKKGWRIENRMYEEKTCYCAGVSFPHRYLGHDECLDRKKMLIAARQYAAPDGERYLSTITSADRLTYMYSVRNMAYVAAHDAGEAIKVLNRVYPCLAALDLVESDAVQVESYQELHKIMLYEPFDTSSALPARCSLHDAWVDEIEPRILCLGSGLLGLLCFSDDGYKTIDALSLDVAKHNHPEIFNAVTEGESNGN